MIRYLKDWLGMAIDRERFEFLDFLNHVMTRSELAAINANYDPFKISMDLDRPWSFEFLGFGFQKIQKEILDEFDVRNIFAILASRIDLARYNSLLDIPEHVSKTPENAESFSEVFEQMQAKVDNSQLTLRYYEWAGKFVLSNSDFSHRTIAVLKYLSQHNHGAILKKVGLVRYVKPPALDGHIIFLLNQKKFEQHEVMRWLRMRNILSIAINGQEVFVAVPRTARLALLLNEATVSHSIWKNPFFQENT